MPEQVTVVETLLRAASYNAMDYRTLAEASNAYGPIRKAVQETLQMMNRDAITQAGGQ